MHHAAKSVEALVDLADILGIKPEDISLGGQLGLAIGARGTGNSLAHYEPDLRVINLTRAGGVGSLAHEWGHALDHSLTDFSKFMSDEYRYTHQSVQNGRVWRMEEKDAAGAARLNPEELDKIEIRRAYRAFFESPEYQQYYRRVREHVQELVRKKQLSAKKANENWKHPDARILTWLGSKRMPTNKEACGPRIRKPIRLWPASMGSSLRIVNRSMVLRIANSTRVAQLVPLSSEC
jgi:hypothetical protein